MSFPFDPTTLVDLAEKLGLVQALKTKLLRQPDLAADQLVTVLGELSKIYGTCDAELLRYLSLSFDPAGAVTQERQVLLSLEGGQIRTRTGEARGHCHKIWNIYSRHLERWFHDVLNPDEARKMKELFEGLSYADSQMGMAIDQLVSWLTQQAEDTLDLVDEQKWDEANQLIKLARKQILPARKAIAKAQADLLNLQAEFITLSGTV